MELRSQRRTEGRGRGTLSGRQASLLRSTVLAGPWEPAWQDPGNQPALLESAANADLAIEAALLLVNGGTSAGQLGTDGNVDISLNGHSNMKHGKTPGWANEGISVSVSEV